MQHSGTSSVVIHAFIPIIDDDNSSSSSNGANAKAKYLFVSNLISFDMSIWEDYVNLVIFNLKIRESWKTVVELLEAQPEKLFPNAKAIESETPYTKKQKTLPGIIQPSTQVGDKVNTEKFQYEVVSVSYFTEMHQSAPAEVMIAHQKPSNLNCIIKKFQDRELFKSCFGIYKKLRENPHERIVKMIDCTNYLDFTNSLLVFEFFDFTTDWCLQTHKQLQEFSRQLLEVNYYCSLCLLSW
jgi:hypothetical protein